MFRSNPSTTPLKAKFRQATAQDVKELYTLWMQAHTNPFMVFEIMAYTDFIKEIFPKMLESSEIYVLEIDEKIIATKRVYYGKNEHRHVAIFASFAVHQDYLGRGFGQQMTLELMAHIKSKKLFIDLIEISLETDNPSAFKLAKKMGFMEQVCFPDWLLRQSGSHRDQWYVAERFLSYFVKPELYKTAKPIEASQLPILHGLSQNDTQQFTCKYMDSNQVVCQVGGKTVVSCTLDAGVRRYGHIQFIRVKSEPDCDLIVLQQFLRKIICYAANKYKKVEIFTPDEKVQKVLMELGLHHRGTKIASYKIADKYFDEAGFDMGFFDIEHAHKFAVKANIAEEIAMYLEDCKEVVDKAHESEEIDEYGYIYLQNLAYQIVTSNYDATHPAFKQTAMWKALIQQLPEALVAAYNRLLKFVHPPAHLWGKTLASAATAAGFLFAGCKFLMNSGSNTAAAETHISPE